MQTTLKHSRPYWLRLDLPFDKAGVQIASTQIVDDALLIHGAITYDANFLARLTDIDGNKGEAPNLVLAKLFMAEVKAVGQMPVLFPAPLLLETNNSQSIQFEVTDAAAASTFPIVIPKPSFQSSNTADIDNLVNSRILPVILCAEEVSSVKEVTFDAERVEPLFITISAPFTGAIGERLTSKSYVLEHDVLVFAANTNAYLTFVQLTVNGEDFPLSKDFIPVWAIAGLDAVPSTGTSYQRVWYWKRPLLIRKGTFIIADWFNAGDVGDVSLTLIGLSLEN